MSGWCWCLMLMILLSVYHVTTTSSTLSLWRSCYHSSELYFETHFKRLNFTSSLKCCHLWMITQFLLNTNSFLSLDSRPLMFAELRRHECAPLPSAASVYLSACLLVEHSAEMALRVAWHCLVLWCPGSHCIHCIEHQPFRHCKSVTLYNSVVSNNPLATTSWRRKYHCAGS